MRTTRSALEKIKAISHSFQNFLDRAFKGIKNVPAKVTAHISLIACFAPAGSEGRRNNTKN
jgi:hypothetical protein